MSTEKDEHSATKKFKAWFIQDWGTYPNETMVVVGYGPKEIRNILEKAGTGEQILKEYDESDCEEAAESSLGFMTDFNNGSSLLWLASFDANNWDDFDVLVHEIMHLVQKCMIKMRGMEDEYEAQAYQLEYLFRSIRKKLITEYEKYEGKSVVQKVSGRNKKNKSTHKAKRN